MRVRNAGSVCVCRCVCARRANVQMEDVSVEKFMMPCLEVPGGYLVIQLALQSGAHTQTHRTCESCMCLLESKTELDAGNVQRNTDTNRKMKPLFVI